MTRSLLSLALLAAAPGAAAAGAAPRPPPAPPSTGAVASGVWRNVFVEAGYPKAAADAKVDAAFRQLYVTGDAATQRIAFNVTGNMTYVTDAKNHDVRTEGMSYGMMVAVQMDERALFDRLWRFVLTFMYHGDASDPLHGWSAWHTDVTGKRLDQGPAPDGETFFVTALYFAGARWGNTGAYNYTLWADTVLKLVTSKPSPGQMFDPASNVVRFDPSQTFTDPSYVTPHFYTAWGAAGSVPAPGAAASWRDVAAAGRGLLLAATGPAGLAPNMCAFDGTKGGWDTDYQDDAWRVVRNWATDYAWYAAEPRQIDASNKLIAFFKACGTPCNCDYFNVATGACTRPQYSAGQAAMVAVAALASNSSDAWAAVDALWAAPIPSGDDHDTDRYYSGSLYLEALLHLSGRYRAWL